MAQKAETLVPNLEIEMNLGLTVTNPDGDTRAEIGRFGSRYHSKF